MEESVKPVVPVDEPAPVRPGKGNYAPNSHAARDAAKTAQATEAKPKLSSVVSSPVEPRKKGFGKKISEAFTGDDMQSVGNYLLIDVMIPAAKSFISDMVIQGIERTLYGDSGGRSAGRSRSGGTNYTSYNRMYNNNGSNNDRRGMDIRNNQPSRRARTTHDFGDIILNTRAEAEEVMFQLKDRIQTYGVTTVSDLYDLLDFTDTTFTDTQFGWFDLEGFGAERTSRGFRLNLPRPEKIDS